MFAGGRAGRVVPDVHHGRTLMVEGAAKLARKHRCDAIHAHLPPRLNWLVAVSRDRGYEQDAWRMCKPLPGGHPRCEETRTAAGARSRR